MREVITIQVGQCGNQMGGEFWKTICREHGLSDQGIRETIHNLEDRKDIFFYEADDGRYVPRSVLVDLEPRVIAQYAGLFNPENIFIPNEGGGAGNNWAHGYYIGKKYIEDIMDIVQREAEGCDCQETFSLMHSIAGGTGSGFGSLILESIADSFPKKILQSYSIFPNNQESSDVVVQPYNSILTLERVINCCDSILVMDNSALGRITSDSLRIETPTFEHINSLISTVISSATSTIRFPGYMYSNQQSINSCLVPFNTHKFVVPSYTPFVCEAFSRVVRKTNCSDVMRRLLLPKTRLATFEPSQVHSVVSLMSILHGVENSADVSKSIMRLMDKREVNFVSWMPPSFNVALSRSVRTRNQVNRISGLALCNTSGITGLLDKICRQYEVLKKQKAFIDIYRKFGVDISMFESAKETVGSVLAEYYKCELPSYGGGISK